MPCIFQQDHSKLHTAAIARAWLHRRRAQLSCHSPDLSQTENIWLIMKPKIWQRTPRTVEQLESYTRQEGKKIIYPKISSRSPHFAVFYGLLLKEEELFHGGKHELVASFEMCCTINAKWLKMAHFLSLRISENILFLFTYHKLYNIFRRWGSIFECNKEADSQSLV